MRSAVVLGAVIGFAFATDAYADQRTTTVQVNVRKKAGEKEAVVGTLPAGTPVDVLREEGRWLRIRAKKLEGYVTRSTVSSPVAPVTSPPVWSASRRKDGVAITDLFVEITAPNAQLLAAPDAGASKIAELARGVRLSVIDASNPAWIHAHDDQGHDGWVARAAVDNGASAVVVTGVDLKTSEPRDQITRPTRGRITLRTDLGIGFRSLGMDLTSGGEGGRLSNAIVDANAVALVSDTTAIIQMSGTWFVAVDARAHASDASPGLEYHGLSSSGTIPFRTFGADVGARAGLRVKRAFDVSLGAGVHYDAFLTEKIMDTVDNVGNLPRERVVGLTLGAVAEIVPPDSPFSATARVDGLVIGRRTQTPGLEDGTSNTVLAISGGLTVRYLLGSHWAVFGAYSFSRASTSWSGMSLRNPGAIDSRRIDTAQLLNLGVSAEL